jgi:ParB family chromosome partitioning protein
MAGQAKAGAAKAKRPRRPGRRKQAARSAGLEPADCSIGVTPDLAPAAERVEEEGGCVVATFRDPLGGHALVLAVVPIDRIEPTPFQRDLSEAHHKRLAEVIHKTGRFLDPVIAVPAPEKGFWTPNGYHRLEAMRRLGARSITALIIPDREVARQILALNTEKAHNLKERSLEVFRIYRGLVQEEPRELESRFSFYLEDPSLVTLGIVYDQRKQFSGGAYHPVLRRVEEFADEPVAEAFETHRHRAALVAELEDRVAKIIAALKERGLQSPYLRSFVVARINPLRWIKGDDLPPAEKVLGTMLDRAAKFNLEKVKQQDLAGAYGAEADE